MVTRINRANAKFEKAAIKPYARLISKQSNLAASAYEETGDLNEALDIIDTVNEQWEETAIALFKKTAMFNAQWLFEEYNDARKGVLTGIFRKGAETIFEENLEEFVALWAANEVVEIVNTTKLKIRRVVMRGLQEGLNPRQIAEKIKDTIGDLPVSVRVGDRRISRVITARNRAQMIARTEVHNAQNYGNEQAAIATGGNFLKEWVTASDDRVRDSHLAAESRYSDSGIPLADLYQVGRVKLLYPGDPNATGENVASEIINCRCFSIKTLVD